MAEPCARRPLMPHPLDGKVLRGPGNDRWVVEGLYPCGLHLHRLDDPELKLSIHPSAIGRTFHEYLYAPHCTCLCDGCCSDMIHCGRTFCRPEDHR